MATAEAIHLELHEMLKTVDWDVTTERMLRTQLAAKVGSVDAFHDLIAREIEAHLHGLSTAAEAPPPAQQPAASRKRALGAGAAEQAGHAGEHKWQLLTNSLKYLTVSRVKSASPLLVHLRTYYEAGGEHKPGKQGIALRVPEWEVLAANLPEISRCSQEQHHDYKLQLTPMRHVYFSEYNGRWLLHVREMYQAGGELRPGKVGAALSTEELQTLVGIREEVAEKLRSMGAGDEQQQQQQQQAAIAATTTVGPPAKAPRLSGPGKSKPGTAAAAPGRGVSSGWLELGANKRAGVEEFKGATFLVLREFYAKPNGEMAPGAKGINLKPDEWRALLDGAPQVTAALDAPEAGSSSFSLPLADKRRVNISVLRGQAYVNVREWYTDKGSGQEKPGKAGLALSRQQWQALTGGMAQLQAQMEAAGAGGH